MKCLFVSSRSVCVLLREDGDYEMLQSARLMLNGRFVMEESRSVTSLFALTPDSDYLLTAAWPDHTEEMAFRTERETAALDVRRFGARGDGEWDDTAALQAAILCCPAGGRVTVPKGRYRTGPLFLKSHMTLEIKDGAVLQLLADRSRFPMLPGVTFTGDGEYLLGSWEGNPLTSFASALTGIGVEDVRIIGPGTVDGCGRQGDWWIEPKKKRGAYRPRLFYLKDCRNVTVQGVTFRNSPAWNLHPTYSENVSFLNVRVEAPCDSPNTDGFDPESCRHVRMLGTCFSVGDDCIAIKSGKIYMGRKYHAPCEDIEIAYCAMLDGHGGVTVGSEMAGGVRDVRVHHCLMRGNDRGLRIKTRRGRGRNGVIDGICFSHVRMENVKVPLVVNCLYFCDPDGHTPFVQSREKQPVDEGTPTVGRITFEQVRATGCTACAGYILGLPERPVECVVMRDCHFAFQPDAAAMAPAMAEGVETVHNRGVISRFAEQVILDNVIMEGIDGESFSGEEK